MNNPPEIRILQPDVVKHMLENKRDKLIVLDVRDDDFSGGHIVNCTNLPSDQLMNENDIDQFLDSIPPHIELVIVHCFLSQVRGPSVARRLTNRLSQLERLGKPEICVMSGGWRKFHYLYGDDTTLCEYD